MQTKPAFPAVNCNIRIPDSMAPSDLLEDEEPPQRRQQLINFAHLQWGFNNWSWAVTKQDLDFVEISNGKYTAGVVSYVSVRVRSLNIHRENIGYATSAAPHKGAAIHSSRKCAVTNALRETLLSFGGTVATELMELLEAHKNDVTNHNQNPVHNHNQPSDSIHENNQNIANTNTNKPVEKIVKKDETKPPSGPLKNVAQPVAKARPISANEPAGVPPSVANRPQPTATASVYPAVVNRPQPTASVYPAVANRPQPTATASVPPAVANRPQPTAHAPRHPPPAPLILRPNPNEVRLEDMSEEEARAERKRRQRQAQEEFRLKRQIKQKEMDDNQEQEVNNNSSLDTMLMAIPSQDIVIEETGNTERPASVKRRSPAGDGGAAKRLTANKLHNIEMK